MSSADPPPNEAQQRDIDAFTDALYDLLQARALSLGLMDIAVEVDGWFVDLELLFAVGPDMGVSVHTGAGEARVCELVGEDAERWLGEPLVDLDVFGSGEAQQLQGQSLRVLQCMLDARRPLLTKE